MLETPFRLVESRYIAMTHFCSGTLLDCMTVPVLTLKYSRQSPQWYGIGVSFGTAEVFTEPQLGQCRTPSGQRMSSSHLRAAASSGNIRNRSITEMPWRSLLPGAFLPMRIAPVSV